MFSVVIPVYRQYGEDGHLYIQKRYFEERGLTPNMDMCRKGRNANIRELHGMGLISRPYMFAMLLDQIKYPRRLLIRFIDRCIAEVKK